MLSMLLLGSLRKPYTSVLVSKASTAEMLQTNKPNVAGPWEKVKTKQGKTYGNRKCKVAVGDNLPAAVS